MAFGRTASESIASNAEVVDAFLKTLKLAATGEELATLMAAFGQELGFRHYALIHHADLRSGIPGLVDIKDYPSSITQRLIGDGMWRRDPVIRACLFAGQAFLWSDLPRIIQIDRRDRDALRHGAAEGLEEGISVPYSILGDAIGSCTFAGLRPGSDAKRLLGIVQIAGVFAFGAARRIVAPATALQVRPPPRLHPRPRDCVMLAGRGLSNKEIARTLGLTPRTVDGYLTEARVLFDAHDRTELVVAAIIAGEVGLDEVRQGQPE